MNGKEKLRAFYAFTPGAPFYQAEFGFFTLEKWREQGYIRPDEDLAKLFGFDEPAEHFLGELGWCDAAFSPAFDETVLEDRGEYELVQDTAGRGVLYFKGRRNGFMPEYVSHPVIDQKSFRERVLWRLDPASPERYRNLDERMRRAREARDAGMHITQNVVGGYMYLRSLIGPVDLLYKFYDEPQLIHECMRAWLALADAVTERHQRYTAIDELYFGEDICYNHGSLISHAMIREFLFPYYKQLIENMRARNGKTPLVLQLDTDGWAGDVIDVYRELGFCYFSPLEVASGCDAVELGRKYPDLLLRGGVDKRALAAGRDAIDRMIDSLMPAMKARGGFIPMCDHGVPEEVEFEDYLYYRKRMMEF